MPFPSYSGSTATTCTSPFELSPIENPTTVSDSSHNQPLTCDFIASASDSGVIFDTDSGDAIATIPDSRTWTDGEKFVENAGSNTLSVELFGDQEVSGVEVIFLLPDTLNPVANFKSNGPGLTLLSDRDNENLIPAVYWETQLGEQMETQLGERLAFRV